MEHDRFIDKVWAQREHLPESADLAAVETELRALAVRLREIEKERQPAHEAFDAAANDAKTLRTRKNDVEERLNRSDGSAKELAALHQEVSHLAQLLSDAEDQEIALLLELEPLDELAESVRAQAQPLAARRQKLQAAIVELHGSLDDELAHRRVARAEAAAQLSDDLRRRYEAAASHAGVAGAARVVEGRCDGCRITLTPLDAGRVKSAGDGFVDCPQCGRLLLTC